MPESPAGLEVGSDPGDLDSAAYKQLRRDFEELAAMLIELAEDHAILQDYVTALAAVPEVRADAALRQIVTDTQAYVPAMGAHITRIRNFVGRVWTRTDRKIIRARCH